MMMAMIWFASLGEARKNRDKARAASEAWNSTRQMEYLDAAYIRGLF